MKNIAKIILILFFPLALLPSCDSILEVDSDRHIFENEHRMVSANDTLYSMFGVFSQLQKLADSYVILGELRGDLMDVSENSNRFLREVNQFNFSPNNPFTNNIRDYYAVINNCNYIIHHIDTAVVRGGIKVMQRNYAAAKAIRAWTYMQLMLNFGKVTYYDSPILTIDDAKTDYTVITDIKQLAQLLVDDLQPVKNVSLPNFGSLLGYNTQRSFFPIRFLLGDLYLWMGEYELAANEYRDLMYLNSITITNSVRSTLQVVNNVFTGNPLSVNWNLGFAFGSNEQITNIVASNQHQRYFTIDSLAEARQIVPSEISIQNWLSQRYIHSATVDTLMDMRMVGSISGFEQLFNNTATNLRPRASIHKFNLLNPEGNITKQVSAYRAATLYLRYAEAVNRLGKPHLAMATLKHGLRGAVINNNRFVPPSEKDSILPNFMNFSDERFNNNIGVRARGCGNMQLDTTYFVIPRTMLSQDSIIKFVEDLIITELALETAFEGNRFHDLKRVAIRRNDNAYLADRVAAKHAPGNREAIRTRLMNRANWVVR